MTGAEAEIITAITRLADKDQRTGSVYALVVPDQPDRMVYVGSTVLYPSQRLWIHIRNAETGRPTPICSWIRGCLARGVRPEIRVLERVRATKLEERERVWMAKLRADGHALLNTQRAYRRPRRRPSWDAAMARLRSAIEVTR